MAYTAEQLDGLLDKFETCLARQAAVQDKMVKLRAAERDTLKVAEDLRDLCQRALKGKKEKLQEVFGTNGCMRIGRPRLLKQDVEMSDMHKSDDRWKDLDEALNAIEEVLRTLGVFKPWVPGTIPPPGEVTYRSWKSRFNPGERINLRPEISEGDVESWSVEGSLPDGLMLNTSTGIITGRFAPNFEMPSTTFVIVAKNSSGESKFDLTFSVSVAPPGKTSYPVTDVHVGEPISWNIKVEDGGPPSSFSVSPKLPKGVSIDTATGLISGVVMEPSGALPTMCKVTATNGGGSSTCDVGFRVLQSEPDTISYPDLQKLYPQKTPIYLAPEVSLKKYGDPKLFDSMKISPWMQARRVMCSRTGMTYSVSPPLPEGVKLDATTGVISGSSDDPVSPGTYTVTATNSAGSSTAEITFEIRLQAPSELTFPDENADHYVNQSMLLKPQVVGIIDEWEIEGDLPDGLSFDKTSGQICGVPTALCGPCTVKITAKNSEGTTESPLTLSIVRPAPSNLSYPALQDTYQVRQDMEIQPTFDGDVFEFSVSPALPAGLSMDPATGRISGQPTAITDEAEFTVTAKNETGATTTTLKFKCNLDPPANLSYPSVDDHYTVCEEVNIKPELDGGATTWSVEPKLPDGLALDPETGVISGRPTVKAAETDYVITASNEAGGTSAVVSFHVLETPPSGLQVPSAQDTVYLEESVNWEPSLEAGESSDWSISPQLPEGMTFNTQTGAIEGTPLNIMEDPVSYTITATNTAGKTSAEISFAVKELEKGVAHPDPAFAALIDACETLEQLPAEPDREKNRMAWMMWMVHRAWLNDETLTDFSFAGMAMPPPAVEPRVAPKLMKAMATNTRIVSLNLTDSNVFSEQGNQLGESLKSNGTLKILELERNHLNSENIRNIAIGLTDNSTTVLETWRFASQMEQGTTFGRPTEEALGVMMRKNDRILKLGVYCQDAHWRDVISRAILKNGDAARKRRKRGSVQEVSLIPAVSKPLQALILCNPPSKAAWDVFADDDEYLTIVRKFAADHKACPTAQQLQSAVKGAGKSIAFSKVAPLLNDFRTKLIDSFKTIQVKAKDTANVEHQGMLGDWATKNQNWTVDIWPSDTQRFSFEKKGDPIIELSDEVKFWLMPTSS